MSWKGGNTPGHIVGIDSFYIAQPGRDTAALINKQLAAGRNLLLTPDIYDLSEPIRVTHKDTVVFGLGFATLHPTGGTAAMQVADVDGLSVSGLLFDAGEERSLNLLEVGTARQHHSHATNPISLHDVFSASAVPLFTGQLKTSSFTVTTPSSTTLGYGVLTTVRVSAGLVISVTLA